MRGPKKKLAQNGMGQDVKNGTSHKTVPWPTVLCENGYKSRCFLKGLLKNGTDHFVRKIILLTKWYPICERNYDLPFCARLPILYEVSVRELYKGSHKTVR